MSLKYLHWNNLIGGFLFDPGQEGKIVTLVLSEEDLITIARGSQFEEFDVMNDDDIIQDFKQSWRGGYPGTSGNYIERIVQEDQKALTFYRAGRTSYHCDSVRVDYHPTIMHLVGINLAIINGKDTSRYKRIRQYFDLSEAKFPNMNEHMNWNEAWDNLIWWANDFKKGTLGLLPAKSLSTERFEYIGKPFTFILLSRNQLNDYYKYFFDNDIAPQTLISNKMLLQAFKSVRASDGISAILSHNGPNEDRDLVFTILRQLYNAWDGVFLNQADDEPVKLSFLSRKLRLCFEFDDDGYLAFSFRFKEDTLNNVQAQFERLKVSILANQWSTPIPVVTIPETKIFRDETLGLKLVFKPQEDQLFVFVNGRCEGLNSQVFIESDQILHAASQYILVKRLLAMDLQDWLLLNNGLDLSDEYLRPADKQIWQLFQFEQGFTGGLSLLQKLTLPLMEKLTVESGLKGVDRNEYICGFPLIAKLLGAKGGEVLELSGPAKYMLELEDGQFFQIPDNLETGEYELILHNILQPISLPYNGLIKFSQLKADLESAELEVVEAMPEQDTPETRHFNQSTTLVASGLYNYPVAPQLRFWQAEELNLDNLDLGSMVAIKLMEYLILKGSMSKAAFDQVLAVIGVKNASVSINDSGFYKLSRNTVGGLKENSRVKLELSPIGSINSISPVKPWLFRLGNYQNFFIEGIKTGLQPFKGCLYALGGTYTMELLEQLQVVCKIHHADLKIYREGDEFTLMPPSVFIYSESSRFSVDGILEILGQSAVLPFHRYLNRPESMEEKITEFKNGRMWDLHMKSRYQLFNPNTLAFEKKAGVETSIFPSLSQYVVQAWEKYFILRFEEADERYQGSVDPRWGKYIILNFQGITDVFLFDERRNTLFIPAALRLPTTIGDNLFYLTGRAPATARLRIDNDRLIPVSPRQPGRTYLIYKGILKHTAAATAQNAGHQLISKILHDHD